MRPYIVKYLPVEDEPEEFVRPRVRQSDSPSPIRPSPHPTYPQQQQQHQPPQKQHVQSGIPTTFQLYPKTSPPSITPLKSPVQSKQCVFDENLFKNRGNSVSTAAGTEECSYYLQHVSKKKPPGGLWNMVLMPFRLCQTPLVDNAESEWSQLRVLYKQQQERLEKQSQQRYYNNNKPPFATTPVLIKGNNADRDITNDHKSARVFLDPNALGGRGVGQQDAIPLSEACVNVLNHSWAKEKEWFFLKAPSTVVDDE